MSKKARKYTKKQLRKLETGIRVCLHELRRTPIEDPALRREIALTIRAAIHDPRRNARCRPSDGSLYYTARVVRGAPLPR
jgi:hypothetical protein